MSSFVQEFKSTVTVLPLLYAIVASLLIDPGSAQAAETPVSSSSVEELCTANSVNLYLNDEEGILNPDRLNQVLACGEASVPDLLTALQFERDRYLAIYALGRLGKLGNSAVFALTLIIGDKTEANSIRSIAAFTLGQIGSAAEVVEPALVAVLRDDSSSDSLRTNTVFALGQVGARQASTIALLIDILRSGEAELLRSNAAFALGQIGTEDQGVVSALIEILLSDRSDRVRSNVAYALRQINPTDPAVIEELIQAMQSTQGSIQGAIFYSLGSTRTNHPIVLEALEESLEDDDPLLRTRAARLLGQLELGTATTEALLNMLHHPDAAVRGIAAEELKQAASGDHIVLAALIETVENSNECTNVRILAADSLGHIGRGNSEALAALMAIVEDSSASPNSADCRAIDALSSEQTSDEHQNLRLVAAFILGRMDLAAQSIIVPLVQQFEVEPNEDLRIIIAEALGKSGSFLAVEPLRLALVDDNPLLRATAAEALGKLSATDAESVQTLISLLNTDPDRLVQYSIAIALETIAARGNTLAADALSTAAQFVNGLKRRADLRKVLEADRVGVQDLLNSLRNRFRNRSQRR